MRYVPHTIRHAPDLDWKREAHCTTDDCGEFIASKDEDAVQMWCLRHTGRNPGHDTFRRVFTDHARVQRTA